MSRRRLSHIDEQGQARMVDVGDKPPVHRRAVAEGFFCAAEATLCHTLPLDVVQVDFERAAPDRLRVIATASITAKTGVEMEALTAVAVAALTLYDMTKGVDKDLRIEGIRLVSKTKDSPPVAARHHSSSS
jgi:cyclic pyranopterin phosphate synthase